MLLARSAGDSRLHVAVDDFSRVAYAGLLPDEHRGTCAAFMDRRLSFFEGLWVAVKRVMTDNGPGCHSGHNHNGPLADRRIRHGYTKPFSPLTERQGGAC